MHHGRARMHEHGSFESEACEEGNSSAAENSWLRVSCGCQRCIRFSVELETAFKSARAPGWTQTPIHRQDINMQRQATVIHACGRAAATGANSFPGAADRHPPPDRASSWARHWARSPQERRPNRHAHAAAERHSLQSRHARPECASLQAGTCAARTQAAGYLATRRLASAHSASQRPKRACHS